MNPPLVTGPQPPYNNPPIEPEDYQPSRFVISNVALGITTTVTTTEDHNYVIGQLVRLIIPKYFGCRQLNERSGIVISIPSSTQVELSIDSLQNVDSFVSSSSTATLPQILAIGDVNSGIISLTGRSIPSTNIPGSFINISP